MAEELAYIEALRERLLNGVREVAARVKGIFNSGRRLGQNRMETLTRVRRLSAAAVVRIAGQFAELDAHSQDVLVALGNLDTQRSLIRSGRDGLYRQSRAWEPILQAWKESDKLLDDAMWRLLSRTYQFLAPRYMPVQEWQAFIAEQRRLRPKPLAAVMTW
jgi:hypothetical protein